MKKIILCLITLVLSANINAQVKNSEYLVVSVLNAHEFRNGECVDSLIKQLCPEDEFIVKNIMGNVVTIMKTKKGKYCTNNSFVGMVYCIDKSLFSNSGSIDLLDNTKKWGTSSYVSILTVPFKFTPGNYKVYPSAQIGGFGGLQHSRKDNGFEFGYGLIAGVSSIPLNDLNAVNDPLAIKTVAGVTLGGGLQFNIWKGVNVNFVYAVDLYNIDNVKAKREWISFGFGYNFMTKQKNQIKRSERIKNDKLLKN